MQERYYTANPYNVVRIILGKSTGTDAPADNVYTRAAGFFRDWRQTGIFLQDAEPAIYRYAQTFARPDGKQELERIGFIALGKIEDYSANVVFRHEQTLAKPKADRLELLRATRAHFGQLFMLYSDPAGEIDGALSASAEDMENGIQVRDEYGVLHQVRKVSDPVLIQLVRDKMRDKKLIIADGHHRYETALNYRNQRRAKHETAPSELAPYELVMMTFINMDSPGLVILPTHRVVHGLPSFDAETFLTSARAYFNVEEVDPTVNASRATAILREAGHVSSTLLAVTSSRVFLLHSPKAPSSMFPGLSIRQQSLDVVQLHKVLLEGVLGLSEESIRNQQNLSYIRDAAESMKMVRDGNANVAFLMNPCRMEQVRDIAFASEVLPQKSTDFFPKLLSGLTIYALE